MSRIISSAFLKWGQNYGKKTGNSLPAFHFIIDRRVEGTKAFPKIAD